MASLDEVGARIESEASRPPRAVVADVTGSATRSCIAWRCEPVFPAGYRQPDVQGRAGPAFASERLGCWPFCISKMEVKVSE